MSTKTATIPILLALLFTGCAQQSMTTDPFAMQDQGSFSPVASNRSANRASQSANSQSAYRRELLKSQLEQSQLDLQAAKSMEERQSVQQRIDLIKDQLHRLGGRG